MSLGKIIRSPASFQRVIEILRTLWKHGLGHVVTRLNVQEHMPIIARLASRGRVEVLPPDLDTLAHRLVLVLQELGPTFVKLGQILSTRPDFLPESFIAEFRKLQDDVKPFPTEEARAIIEHELGGPVGKFFREFPETPVASGSIAQVYHAELEDGTPVAVKIRRPGIKRLISRDIGILRYLAGHAERTLPEISPMRIVDEFENSIRKELDFIVEASYTAKFHEMFQKVEGVKSPAVYWEYCTGEVLTMELLSGVSPNNTEELDRLAIDRKKLARTLGTVFLNQYVDHGLFHADPHPGNILIDKRGNICLIDFGMSGHLSDDLLSELSTALIAISRKNIDILIDVYAELGETALVDRRQLKPDLMELFDKYYGMPLKRIDVSSVINDGLAIARRHKLRLPRDMVMLMRSMMIVTNVARNLDPDFNFADLIEPEARRVILRKLSPANRAKSFGSQAWQLSRLIRKLPVHVRLILQKIESGTLAVAFKHQGLEGFMHELDRVSNRLSVAIILGSIVVASSITLHANVMPVRGVSAVGIVGFLLAGMLGLWLAWDILRSGRY